MSGYYGSLSSYEPYKLDAYDSHNDYALDPYNDYDDHYDPYNDYHDYGYDYDGLLLHGDGHGLDSYAATDYGYYEPVYDHHYEFPRYASGQYYHHESESDEALHFPELPHPPQYDPIPHSFNYNVYKRFNTYPGKESDTSGDTVPIYSDSEHGHFSRSSNNSYTTSDADGHHTNSDES